MPATSTTTKKKLPAPEVRYRCESCGTPWTDEEPGTLRECSSDQCGQTFVAEFGDNNCPDCGRGFTRRLADHGCDSCQEEMDEQEGFACAHGAACPVGGFHELEDEGVDTDAPEWELSPDATEREEKDYYKRLKKAERESRDAAILVAHEAAERCVALTADEIAARAERERVEREQERERKAAVTRVEAQACAAGRAAGYWYQDIVAARVGPLLPVDDDHGYLDPRIRELRQEIRDSFHDAFEAARMRFYRDAGVPFRPLHPAFREAAERLANDPTWQPPLVEEIKA